MESPAHGPPLQQDGSPAQRERWLRAAAESSQSSECGQCHGPRIAFEVEDDFCDINDLDAVFRQGQLIRCDARHSPVILTTLDRSMPPPPKALVRGGDEIAMVRDVTDFGCVGR